MTVSPSSFSKQPNEVFNIEVKFDKRVAASETITEKEVIGYDADDEIVTSTIISGSSISGRSIIVGVKGGTSGVDYKITVRVNTDSKTPDNVDFEHEADITMAVLET